MKTKAVLRTRTGLMNVDEVAKELGRSPYHIRAVLHGRRRPGGELARMLKERGIETQELRPPQEQWV